MLDYFPYAEAFLMRIHSALVCCMLFFVSFVYADNGMVSNIVIEGLHNVKLKNVLSVVKLKEGKSYSSDVFRENARSIAELGYFDNVEVRFDNHTGVLTFVVSEKPYVEHLVFKGNVGISTGNLKSTSALKEKEYYDLVKLEEAKSKISTLYRDKGYADCLIEVYPSINVDTNKMAITFLITENNKIVIGSVKIEGIISYKEKEIINLMKIRPKKIFKESLFKTDLVAIQEFYKNNGFMDYQFVSSTSTYNEARTEMFLTLNISEGERYEIGSVTYSGNFAVGDKEISKIIKFKKYQVFNQHKIDKTIQDVHSAYHDKGYLNVMINSDFNKQGSGCVNVNLSIQENFVTYVGNIYIYGLVSTKDKVIRREVNLKTGDVFSIKKLHKSIGKINTLGFIESVETEILPTDVSGVLDLSLNITESQAGLTSAIIGLSSIDKLTGQLQIQHINFLGLGQKLSLSCDFGVGKRKQNYEINWTESRIFDKNASLTLSGFNNKRNRNYASVTNAYREHRVGLASKVGTRPSEYVNLLFGYTFEHVKLSDIKDDIKEEIEKSSDLSKDRTTSVFAQCVYDSRDNAFDPSRGSRQLLNLQLASNKLGGDVNFVKGIAKSTLFFPTFWKFVLSVNMEVDAIIAYCEQKQVPIYEKFYVGDGGIRGYQNRTQRYLEDCCSVKGVVNVECKFPIVASEGKTIVHGVIFYDIGGAWEDFARVNLTLGKEKENLHSGVGCGIRFMTPIGPINLGLGYGLNHKKGEKLHAPHLYFGSVF